MSDKKPEDIFADSLTELFQSVAKLPSEDKRLSTLAVMKMTSAFQLIVEQKNKMERVIRTDVLTELPNRAGLMMDIVGRLERMKRYGDTELAIAFIDLDGFKQLNDNCGHDKGDDALIQTGKRLVSKFRTTDTLGRLGGDELLLVISNKQGEMLQDKEIKSKVREALEGLVYWSNNKPFPIGASIGISRIGPNDDLKYESNVIAKDLIEEADKNMYGDKKGKQKRLSHARQVALSERGPKPS
jgi:diguanylate cyclase (GGDEF)-like protein